MTNSWINDKEVSSRVKVGGTRENHKRLVFHPQEGEGQIEGRAGD